ncbi:hypothetical protein BELL_0361g00100 [Botrytis elliptica]|uniref:Uncharacterized protein n=1 Tax=Botrytis elliptica TaxID=278938 RepID=A0A4Z1JPC6_9HELO|nr:hypothetical protein BELL_0361g00100 [Botrytis elliptica]
MVFTNRGDSWGVRVSRFLTHPGSQNQEYSFKNDDALDLVVTRVFMVGDWRAQPSEHVMIQGSITPAIKV